MAKSQAELAASQRYKKKHADQIRAAQQKYRQTERAKVLSRATQRKANARLKVEVLIHYGNGQLKCCWQDCDVVDVDMLSLDHINNDGCKEQDRKESGGRGQKKSKGIYRRVKREGYPSGFQTLCLNHQMKKEILRKKELWT